jgi:ribokinase
MYDLISIGDCVMDTFVFLEDAEVILKKGEPRLSIPFGAKVPVGPSVSFVGGNAANNAVGSARLKLKTAIYTNVGNKDDDEADDRIKAKFKKEGIDTRYVAESWDLQSNHHIVLDYKGERTIFVHHQPWKFNLPDLDKTKWVYLTSLSPSFTDSNLIEQLINYLERSGAKLAYQPGTFQIKLGAKKNARILSLTEFFIVNLEEAKHILGDTSEAAIKKLLKGIADLGPRKVVITDGREGSYGYEAEKYFKLGVFPDKVVEATGAGDAYATGTLAGLFHGEDLPSAMRWGAANGAAVVEQVGPQAGLLTLNKMHEVLKENSKIVAKEI